MGYERGEKSGGGTRTWEPGTGKKGRGKVR